MTAGGTREAIDPVRYIGNRSSGRMGYEIAAAAWRRGADVLLVSGPSHLPVPPGVELRRIESAEQMLDAVRDALPAADALVMAAAVADFRPADAAAQKIKKEAGAVPQIALEATADVLRATREARRPDSVVVGFALETNDAVENGRRKLEGKGLDLLVVNDATEPGAGFEVETNRVVLLQPGRADEALPLMSKAEVADRILDRVEALLPGGPRRVEPARARRRARDDPRDLLRSYLRQRRELGEEELVLDRLSAAELQALLADRAGALATRRPPGRAERDRRPSTRAATLRGRFPPRIRRAAVPRRRVDEHVRAGAPVPGARSDPPSPRAPAAYVDAEEISSLPILSQVREIALGCPRCGLAKTARTWSLARGGRTRT